MSGRRGGPPDIHLYDIERIEVLRGPEGTYYGASAVSGTVRIITKQPNPEGFEYGVDLTGGTISDGDTAYTSGARVDPLPQEWWSCPGWKYEDYSSALFGDVSWDFTDRLTVSARTRYFRWEDGDDWGFNCGYPWESKGTFSRNEEAPEEKERSYKFNVRYDLSEDLLVYFAYGEGLRPGFRNPNVTHAEVPMFVEADYTKSYEVGWKSTLADGRVTLNGAVYMIDWDNFQTTLYDLLTVPFEFRRNVEGSTIQGVEFDLLARINVNWTVAGGLAYNTAELEGDFATIAREPRFVYAEDGRRLAHVPEWSWTLGIRYDKDDRRQPRHLRPGQLVLYR